MKNYKVLLLIVIVVITSGCSIKVSNIFQKESEDMIVLEGDIQNTIIPATSTVAGKIIEMNKKQGEPVKKGEIIAVIDYTNQQYKVEQLQAIVNMKQARLDELKTGTRPEQLEQAEAEVRAAKAQLELLQEGNREEQIQQAQNNVAIAEEAIASANITYQHVEDLYQKKRALYEKGAISEHELDEAKYKLDMTAKQLETLQYQLDNAKKELSLLKKGPTQEEINAAKANYDAALAQLQLLQTGATEETIRAAEADVQQAIAQLNQAKNDLENTKIMAMADGIIISKNYELGDVVQVSSNIADIAVTDDVYVLCYLPTDYLDQVYYNQQVTVVTSLGEQIGKVSYIDLHHEYTPKDKQSIADGKRIATKIKITIDDQDGKLKNGMKAEVKIPLQK